MNAIRLTVRGKVQGVFFRDWTVERARSLGLAGWVRNRADGSVEIYAVGADNDLDQFARDCGNGPERARVETVDREDVTVEPAKGFNRKPTA